MENKPPILAALTRERNAKGLEKAESAARSFSITEKVLFLVCLIVFTGAVLSLIGKISDHFSVNVPQRGGSLVEGIVGTPRFVNPLLAVSDADRDLTQLVYSGLLAEQPDGTLVPDLAQSYTISPDGLTYTVTMRQNATFQDGTPVTADDVVYTVQKAQDPALKSPRFVNWDGVTVEKTGPYSVAFQLKQPYAPFINNLTLGILPSHLWKSLTSDQIPFSSLNTNAVGSGPYIVGSVAKTSDGIPTQFSLKSNPDYALGQPYITTITIKSYASEEELLSALENHSVDSAANLSPASAEALSQGGYGVQVMTAPLTRVFGVFFNQNQNEVLAHKEVRQALSEVVDKNDLISSVLGGYGTAADGPLPSPFNDNPGAAPVASSTATVPALPVAMKAMAVAANATSSATTTAATTTPAVPPAMADAMKVLAKAGWKKNPSTGFYELKGKTKGVASTTLAVEISTANVPELELAAKKISDAWTALGVQVSVQVFEPSDLNQSVIRPRKYDALLFGLVTGKGSDLYPFWDSSQRNDPGLNVAMYTNQTADKLLETMRTSTSTSVISSDYAKLEAQLNADIPAIFLWSPDFIYAIPDRLQGVSLGEITTSSDRFLGVEKWYIDTDHIWTAFVKDPSDVINK